jgi:hypothetical protein
MNAFDRGLAWYRYKHLEDEFINSTFYFPFQEKHKDIWSEFFSDLLTKIGNSVDTFFRNMLEAPMFDKFSHVSSLKVSGRTKDINDFRDFFDPIYKLSSAEVQTAYGLTLYGRCTPFEGFLDKDTNKIPKWWIAYDHIKHKWFDCIEEATLENTIKALASLFLLNVLHKESQKYLIGYQDVIVSDFSEPPESRTYISHIFEKSMIGVPKGYNKFNYRARTPLFIHVFRLDETAPTSGVVF